MPTSCRPCRGPRHGRPWGQPPPPPSVPPRRAAPGRLPSSLPGPPERMAPLRDPAAPPARCRRQHRRKPPERLTSARPAPPQPRTPRRQPCSRHSTAPPAQSPTAHPRRCRRPSALFGMPLRQNRARAVRPQPPGRLLLRRATSVWPKPRQQAAAPAWPGCRQPEEAVLHREEAAKCPKRRRCCRRRRAFWAAKCPKHRRCRCRRRARRETRSRPAGRPGALWALPPQSRPAGGPRQAAASSAAAPARTLRKDSRARPAETGSWRTAVAASSFSQPQRPSAP
mmetsp:Transcript_10485/g.31566  ORF Transcript_10485/g.31566 Transcript_10485/m.31566 type:complete len:282 (+) Transcript_10485:59-904(+)